jgi:hypothetical protein
VAKAENRDTPKSAPYAIEDDWLNAFAEFPDRKPLADLFRSSKSITPAVRDLLAEYLDPSGPEHGRLVYEPTGLRQIVELLSLAGDYHEEVERRKERGEKSPSRKAAAVVGKKIGRSWRTVSRKLQAWRKIAAGLRRYFYGH